MTARPPKPPPTPLFATPTWRAVELVAADAPALQAFFDANPEYFVAITGEPAGPGEALAEITELPPPDFRWTRRWVIAFTDADDAMFAVASVVSDLPVQHVWHLGLLIVATRLFGTGVAAELHDALVAWARAGGARWMRLGVVQGNARAERFWTRHGYVETRLRHGVAMGARVNTVRVMMKPLEGGDLAGYLALVERDRPDP